MQYLYLPRRRLLLIDETPAANELYIVCEEVWLELVVLKYNVSFILLGYFLAHGNMLLPYIEQYLTALQGLAMTICAYVDAWLIEAAAIESSHPCCGAPSAVMKKSIGKINRTKKNHQGRHRSLSSTRYVEKSATFSFGFTTSNDRFESWTVTHTF